MKFVSIILRVNMMILFLVDLVVFFLWLFLDWYFIKYNFIDVFFVGVVDIII